jgi:hypothetical protein
MYIYGIYIVAVACISLCELDSKPQPTRLGTDSYFGLVVKSTLRGVGVNEIIYYCLDIASSSTATTTLFSPTQHLFHQNEDLAV